MISSRFFGNLSPHSLYTTYPGLLYKSLICPAAPSTFGIKCHFPSILHPISFRRVFLPLLYHCVLGLTFSAAGAAEPDEEEHGQECCSRGCLPGTHPGDKGSEAGRCRCTEDQPGGPFPPSRAPCGPLSLLRALTTPPLCLGVCASLTWQEDG